MFGDSGVESASPSQLHCPLITLPHELIIHIVSLVAPGSHLDFACTCKTVAIVAPPPSSYTANLMSSTASLPISSLQRRPCC